MELDACPLQFARDLRPVNRAAHISMMGVAELIVCWLRARGDSELVEQAADALPDVVTNGSNGVKGLACRVGQFPVLVALSGEERAGVPAAHRDDDVGGLDHFLGPGLGKLAGDIDADL